MSAIDDFVPVWQFRERHAARIRATPERIFEAILATRAEDILFFRTLVAIRRYRFDHMPSGGLLNIRGRVANGLRDNVLADLRRLERDTEAEWATRRDRP